MYYLSSGPRAKRRAGRLKAAPDNSQQTQQSSQQTSSSSSGSYSQFSMPQHPQSLVHGQIGDGDSVDSLQTVHSISGVLAERQRRETEASKRAPTRNSAELLSPSQPLVSSCREEGRFQPTQRQQRTRRPEAATGIIVPESPKQPKVAHKQGPSPAHHYHHSRAQAVGKRKGNSMSSSSSTNSPVSITQVGEEHDEDEQDWFQTVAAQFPKGDQARVARFLQSQRDAYQTCKAGGQPMSSKCRRPQKASASSMTTALEASSEFRTTTTETTAPSTTVTSASGRDQLQEHRPRQQRQHVEAITQALPNPSRVSRFLQSQDSAWEKYQAAYRPNTIHPARKNAKHRRPTAAAATTLVASPPIRAGDPNHHSRRFRTTMDDDADNVRPPGKPKRGTICQCCFEETPGAAATLCSTGQHAFCQECMTRYIEAFVYGEPYLLKEEESFKVLPCMATDCESGFFPHEAIQQASKPQVWEAYQEKIFHVMAMDTIAEDSSADSFSATAPVPPVAAAASANNNDTAVSLDHCYRNIEEAMTAAKLRRCPNCSTPFLKESGYCNKIRCPACRTCVCYMCNQRVPSKGYDHFCVHAYDVCPVNCGKCVLWTNHDEQKDRENLRALATNEANRLWEASLVSSTTQNAPAATTTTTSDASAMGAMGMAPSPARITDGSAPLIDVERLLHDPAQPLEP